MSAGPTHGLVPHHLGYVVESIEAVVDRLVSQLGAGPFLLAERVPLQDVRSRGEPARLIHDSAFGMCMGAPIELTRVADVAPERVRSRWGRPWPRVQHAAYLLARPEAEALRAACDARGMPEYLSARLGPLDNTFHDGSATLGHDIEIHVDVPELRAFFGMVRDVAEGWDGSTDPLRTAPE